MWEGINMLNLHILATKAGLLAKFSQHNLKKKAVQKYMVWKMIIECRPGHQRKCYSIIKTKPFGLWDTNTWDVVWEA